MKKILKYIFVLIIVLVLVVGLYFLYDYIKHKDDCCSCCPNASEGESCISACCKCK